MSTTPARSPEAGWEALARRIEADEAFRAALSAGDGEVRSRAVALLAHLQAVRDRLAALEALSRSARALGEAAADRMEKTE